MANEKNTPTIANAQVAPITGSPVEVESSTPAPRAVEQTTPADAFIKKHGGTTRIARYMRSKLPKNRTDINSFLNEFASNDSERRTMERELKEFTPEA